MSPLIILFSQGRAKAEVVCPQSCLNLCDPMDRNPPGSPLPMGVSGECMLLGSVSSQQRSGVMDIKALGESQLSGLGQIVL